MAFWSFEGTTQSWVGTNCTPSSDPGFHTVGTSSLLLFCSGAGNPSAHSPTGTSGVPVAVGQQVSASADVEGYSGSAGWSACYIGIQWFQSSGAACSHPEDDSANSVIGPSTLKTMTVSATAPASAAFYAVIVGNHGNTITSNYIGYIDNVNANVYIPPPMFPLPILVEILVNNVWQDITDFVYTRDPIVITGGKSSSVSDTASPATMTMTLNNRDGRFSPNFAGGTYYPNLGRKTQIRLSLVNATSSSGNVYTGYRFWGVVSDWPPLSDISGRDVYVQIVPSGPLRQINQGGGAGSALTRYYQKLTGQYAPIAYWPCEEQPDYAPPDPQGDQIGAGIDGGTNMVITSGTPVWKAISSFNGSDPIPVLNRSTWVGLTGNFTGSGDDVYTVPGTYQWVAPTSTVTAKCWGGGGGGTKGQIGNGGGTGGGGGEFAQETSMTVTPGQAYTFTVATGGSPGPWNTGGGNGALSTFQGDLATVTAHGGSGGGINGNSGGAGGTGSGNTIHFHGGAGGGDPGSFTQGGGGGSSAGTGVIGNNGGNASLGTPGAGGAAPAGGGAGGKGGNNQDGLPGQGPGGGGGGGWATTSPQAKSYGGPGAPGQVELVYTGTGGGTQPPANVIRFLMFVPKHGGNPGKVLVRALTSGTVHTVDVQYRSGGKIRLLGYSLAVPPPGTPIIDSGDLAVGADNTTLMVSAELTDSGSNVGWALSAIKPGDSGAVAKVSGTLVTANPGNVTQVYAGPNSDITKTALGHISVQYALIPLWQVSQALNGHHQEVGIDRFIRMCDEVAMGAFAEYSEGSDHWGFETGTQSWAGTNGAVTQSTVTHSTAGVQDWPPAGGTHSLLLTAAGGAGQWFASSPGGTSGLHVIAGDSVSLAADVYCPAALGAVQATINWYNASGTYISTSSGTSVSVAAGGVMTVGVRDTAPVGAAYFNANVADSETKTAGTLLYIDNVRISPQMGPQATAQYRELLKEIENFDLGMLKEAKTLWGLGYRTRLALINQSPSVTLDYTAGTVSPPLAPVVDIQNVKNDITVQRKKGSKISITLASGAMSVQEPPAGTGRFKKSLEVAAAADEQLLALASQLLGLGTAPDERYPQITVELARASLKGNALAPLMSAVAGVTIGDYVKITNLPAWYPSNPVQQLVIGYTETIDGDQHLWTIQWNCVPSSPYTLSLSSVRRW